MTEELLYHYTNDTALLKMLEYRTFWATDTDFLNDSSERSYAADALDDYMKKELPLSRLGALGEAALFGRHLRRLYVVCFTSHQDLLGLWRGYGKGQGYALGFGANDLRGLATPWGVEDGSLNLARVSYGVEESLAAMKGHILASDDTPGAVFALGEALETIMVTTKHEAFRYEEETRIVVSQRDFRRTSRRKDVLHFREGRFSVVPYVVLHWGNMPLRKVVLGPGPHEKVREAGLRLALEQHGHKGVEIVSSQAPYRE